MNRDTQRRDDDDNHESEEREPDRAGAKCLVVGFLGAPPDKAAHTLLVCYTARECTSVSSYCP